MFFFPVLKHPTISTAAASLCYPRHAYQMSQKVFDNAKDVGTIGYNFVAGGNILFNSIHDILVVEG